MIQTSCIIKTENPSWGRNKAVIASININRIKNKNKNSSSRKKFLVNSSQGVSTRSHVKLKNKERYVAVS